MPGLASALHTLPGLPAHPVPLRPPPPALPAAQLAASRLRLPLLPPSLPPGFTEGLSAAAATALATATAADEDILPRFALPQPPMLHNVNTSSAGSRKRPHADVSPELPAPVSPSLPPSTALTFSQLTPSASPDGVPGKATRALPAMGAPLSTPTAGPAAAVSPPDVPAAGGAPRLVQPAQQASGAQDSRVAAAGVQLGASARAELYQLAELLSALKKR